MYAYIHKYSIHVYRPRRMAFEAGRGGSGLEPKLAGLRLTPADFRRTPPPDPPGPRTDPGRTRHRTIRTRGTGGAHLQPDCDQRRAPRTTHTDSLAAGSIAQRASNSYLYRSRKAKSARARQIQSCDLPEFLSALRNSAHRRSFKRWTYTIRL